jgi:hypothetical protein
VAAGIHATVEFAVADPDAAGALTHEAHTDSSGSRQRYVDVVRYFTTLLGEVAPRRERLPASTDQALIDRIATVVGAHIRSGTVESLAAFAPDLVYLTLLPYAGYDGARDYVESFALEA